MANVRMEPHIFLVRKIRDVDIAFENLEARAKELVNSARAPRTMLDYDADWRMLREWCEQAGLTFPPTHDEAITLYVTYLIECGHKVASVTRRIASFRFWYRHLGLAIPDLSVARRVLSGARRELRQKPKQARPLTKEQLQTLCKALGSRPIGVRNRAAIVLGFASGMRRSEIAALRMEDIEFVAEGIVVHIGRSKTDQEGIGRTIGVFRGEAEPCPVEELQAWLALRGADSGPLFCAFSQRTMLRDRGISGKVIHYAVRRAVAAIGLEPKPYSGHTLRASFVTEAVARGAELGSIMKVTGHKRIETLLRYLRPEPFRLKQARSL